MNRQDLEGQEVPEDQPNLRDQNLLGLPGKATLVSRWQSVKQHTGHIFIHLIVSYSLSKNTVFAWGAVRSCRALRSTQGTVRQLYRHIWVLALGNLDRRRICTHIRTRITTRSVSTRNTNWTWGTFISGCSCGSLFSWWTLKKGTGNLQCSSKKGHST